MKGHRFRFELENICRLFLPYEKVHTENDPPHSEDVKVYTFVDKREKDILLGARLQKKEFDEEYSQILTAAEADDTTCELALATAVFHLFVKAYGFTPPWGVLTGVRPLKLYRRVAAENGEEAADEYFEKRLLVNSEKRKLCAETVAYEDAIIAMSGRRSYSLYLSVPFCPTRCHYCSFVSKTVENAGALIPEYVELLRRELAETGAIMTRLGLRAETIYFGGGTPTVLTAAQLSSLTEAVSAHFDLSTVREYTVEAGRPDTVDAEKLKVLADAGVGRISINPQTLQPGVLEAIGRGHTVEQFFSAYELARKIGFRRINVDLIAGLPGDTPDGFADTMERVLALVPENITVHALAMKRAARLADFGGFRHNGTAAQQMAYARKRLQESGYHPYYLYRQSAAAGNQENVGWSLPGKDGLYNVFVMDETHTVAGCGAGAVTKLKDPDADRLERIFNYKYPYEYNRGLEEILRRKERIPAFYEQPYKQ